MLLKFLLILLACYLLVMALLFLFQRRLIYLPSGVPGAPPPGQVPVEARTEEGLTLRGWCRPAAGRPGLAVICLHGNGGNRAFFQEDANLYRSGAYQVYSFDWRGYGGNPGNPSEEGLYRDGEAMLARALAETGLPPEKVILHGRSLGCAVAVELARRHDLGGLVLLSPFTSLADTAAGHYPWAPVRLLLRDRFDSLAKAPDVAEPALVVAGGRDRLVPAAQSETLARALPQGTYRLIEEGGHNGLLVNSFDRVRREVEEFLEGR